MALILRLVSMFWLRRLEMMNTDTTKSKILTNSNRRSQKSNLGKPNGTRQTGAKAVVILRLRDHLRSGGKRKYNGQPISRSLRPALAAARKPNSKQV